jgi:sugar/nucleoside kinase (ribokinase family)
MPIPIADFTGIGENATDVVLRVKALTARDGKTDIVSREVRLGGQVATAVFAAACWGLRTRYVGAAGSDNHGELHQATLRKQGVESHLLRVRSAESRLSYILVEHQTGSRSVLCHRDPRVNLDRRYLKKEWFQRSRLVLVDGENIEASLLAATWSREAAVPVMCDLDVFCEKLLSLLPEIDFPVLSLSILKPLCGSGDPLIALPRIHCGNNSRLVCTTMGQRGALAWNGQRFFYAPAYRVRVLDTTGAGDLFHASFAYGLLQGWEPQDMLEFACAAAGLNCMAHGARGGIGSIRAIEHLRATTKQHPRLYSRKALEQAAARVLRAERSSAKAHQ